MKFNNLYNKELDNPNKDEKKVAFLRNKAEVERQENIQEYKESLNHPVMYG